MTKVVIVAKTRMGNGACVGGLTFEGDSLRLIAADREWNEQFNLDYSVGDVWEIETQPDPDIIPPHIENVIVTNKRKLGTISGIETFIAEQMPPIAGSPEAIFEGLAQTTKAGALYIAERCGLPNRSTMFWIPDQPLTRVEDAKRIRYRYPTEDGGPTLTFTGFQEPLPEIPAGSLIRVSLAHWWRPEEMPDGEYRCYIQLSGWFSPEPLPKQADLFAARPSTSIPKANQEKEPSKTSYENLIPRLQRELSKTFGYTTYRPLQKRIMQNVLRKNDSLAVMPTGSGKSLCYQLPAILFPGTTVVVSPLIALMEDQVLELQEWGVPAVYLNSTLSYSEYLETTARLRACEVKLVYAAPETLLRPETIVLLEDCQVDCLVIDEAHCISEWGHDFRPEYRQLAALRTHLPEAATLAVTATATQRVRQDIKTSLGISDANEFVSSFNRENLRLEVTDKIDGLTQTRAFLDEHRAQAGIIYCATRNQVDNLTARLQSLGYPVLPYHAGMEDETRRRHQHRFRYEEGIIMVATIAFGMGINKSNLRFILHYDLPRNIESYYQQIGRAGRDGLPADCLLLYSFGDIHTIRFFIDQEPAELRAGSEQRLRALLAFLDTQTCRRKPLLAYFGEKYPHDNCQACDNCLEPPSTGADAAEQTENDLPKVNLTEAAKQFIACAQETREIFGAAHLIDVLRGSQSSKVRKFGHEKLPTHGTGRNYTKQQWQHLSAQFIRMGLIERIQPHGSLRVTAAGKDVLQGQEVWGTLPGAITGPAAPGQTKHDEALFQMLRALRAELARARGIPPYIIFHDRTLTEMATYYPDTPEALLRIAGVGQRKLEAYGDQFLPIIQAYCQEHNVQPGLVPIHRSAQPASTTRKSRMLHIWEQFQSGVSIQQIADTLDLTPATIISHLNMALSAGHPLPLAALKATSTLSVADGQEVLKAFEDCGPEFLKPVYMVLNERIPYNELHLWRLIYLVTVQHEAS